MKQKPTDGKLRVFISIPELNIAGAQKMVEQLVTNIDYARYSVLLAIQSEPHHTVLERSVCASAASVVFFNKKLGFHIAAFFRAWQALSAFRPNVIHVHLQSWIYLLPWIVCHRVKVIYTVHTSPKGLFHSWDYWLIKHLFRNSRFVLVAISDAIAKEAEQAYELPAEKIETVYNPVAFRRFSEAGRIPHDTFNFVMVARFSDYKNHLLLIDAFSNVCKTHANLRLTLAGEGEMLKAAKSRAGELGLQNNVAFPGVVEDIPSLLAGADAFILPSQVEGLPMTLLEAEAAGLPVIASKVGGMPDIVRENGFLVEVNNQAALENAMSDLVSDPELCSEFGRVSKTIAAEYDVEKVARQYEGLYEKYATPH